MSPEVPVFVLIIAIPTFFVLRWFLHRFIKDNKKKNWTSLLGSVLLAPILYMGLVITFFSFLFYEPQYDFEKNRWFTDKQARFEMRDDLVESKILNGKSKFEITEFLGEPEFKDSSDIWTYDLGTSKAGFGWQFNSLELTFKNGVVFEVKKIEIID